MNRNNNRMQDKVLSKKLKELKSDYQSIEMSEEQLNQLKIKMKEAKMTGKITNSKSHSG